MSRLVTSSSSPPPPPPRPPPRPPRPSPPSHKSEELTSTAAMAKLEACGEETPLLGGLAAAEGRLRRDIRFFFMSPCEKFRVKGRKPWKMGVQILKIVMVTIQLVVFGLSNQMVVTFREENMATFKHLFLRDYRDTPADDAYAVYTRADFFGNVAHVLNQYVRLRNVSVGNYAYMRDSDGRIAPINLCRSFYKAGTIDPGNDTFSINPVIEKVCIDMLPLIPLGGLSLNATRRAVTEIFVASNLTLDFHRLIDVTIKFKLKTINLQTVRYHELPDCYIFSITALFDNKAHSGRIMVNLDSDALIRECKEWDISGSIQKNTHFMMIFDVFIIMLCLTSFVLCLRSIVKGVFLRNEFVLFYHVHYDQTVGWSDQTEFINGWFILIIISDIFTVIGSILKIEIEMKSLMSYDLCSILLGTSTLLVWVGVIKYMGYFKTYNILILTLRAAFPNVIRFCCCAAMIYLGYCFCGWIVLGPYHFKFRTLNMVSECLFSLINGDDMFSTFSAMKQKSYLVWLFSQLYLYSFISLFIYMILSVFIALITETYETIKHYDAQGRAMSEVDRFLNAGSSPEPGTGGSINGVAGAGGGGGGDGGGGWDEGETACSFLTCCLPQRSSTSH
ncbi:mucolipin-3-like isoform X2 [Petromyzon marinus]|uniref:mucolipin-3-like isoform X2 n=1 Tax=Petromyzon marinus TaxID=7757 RepID=UPI003F711199